MNPLNGSQPSALRVESDRVTHLIAEDGSALAQMSRNWCIAGKRATGERNG
jgi:hypothetical protein